MNAQPIRKESETSILWHRIRLRIRDSLFSYPVVFFGVTILLAMILRQVDLYLMTNLNLPDAWMISPSSGATFSSLAASSVLSLVAIVFSISLVVMQLANQQYSPRVLAIFEQSKTTKFTLSLSFATFVYSVILLTTLLRVSVARVPIVSLCMNFALLFVSLIAFLVFMKSILTMIRVSYIISVISAETSQSIQNNLPPGDAYVACDPVLLEEPKQVIHFTRPPRSRRFSRLSHGLLTWLERSTLVQIASEHGCVLRVLPQYGDYINQGDPIVEVFGETTIPDEKVLGAIFVGAERSMTQDPSYGIRMLVDIALQALSPAVNAPTTAHEVIMRLTHLLAMIAQRPQHTGAFAGAEDQIRLLQPVFTWEDYVDLAFLEIIHYGKEDPQTCQSLSKAYEYLLARVPAANKARLETQRALLSGDPR